MKIAIGIASAGRPKILEGVIGYLAALNVAIPEIYVCTPKEGHRPNSTFDLAVRWCTSKTIGLCAQRNMILDAAASEDWLVFMDDDFLPRGDFFINLCTILTRHSSLIAALTGTVIADGVSIGGIPFDEAVRQLAKSSSFTFHPSLTPVFNAYGCNMAVNMNLIRKGNLRFDENLPQYGWLEDVEFSLQLKSLGRILKAGNCLGVHLGSPAGRQGAQRLGYSQISNPYYICQKHRLGSARFFNYFMLRFLKNLAGALVGNPVRRERLAGNLLALKHLARGTLDPRFILQMT